MTAMVSVNAGWWGASSIKRVLMHVWPTVTLLVVKDKLGNCMLFRFTMHKKPVTGLFYVDSVSRERLTSKQHENL